MLRRRLSILIVVAMLRAMVVASLFVGVNQVYFAIKRVQRDVKGIVVLSGVIFGLLVGLGYLFMGLYGVVGLGFGATVVVGEVWREVWV